MWSKFLRKKTIYIAGGRAATGSASSAIVDLEWF
jgi:hypothetical protein